MLIVLLTIYLPQLLSVNKVAWAEYLNELHLAETVTGLGQSFDATNKNVSDCIKLITTLNSSVNNVSDTITQLNLSLSNLSKNY